MTPLERYTAAIDGRPVDRLPCHPLTMLFASRLVGKPYRDYVLDYRVLAAGQLAVVEAFGVDFVSVISDPCREAHDLGGACVYFEDDAPACDARQPLLADKATLAGLALPDPLAGGRMHDRVLAVAALREAVGPEMSVLGWVEGPIAMAVDLRGMQALMLDTVDDPEFVRDLFAFSVEMEIAFAKAQIEAGAESIGIGDAAASLVGRRFYEESIWAGEKRLVDAVHALGAKVRLHVCGNTTHLVEGFGRLDCEVVDIDYTADLAAARAAMPDTALLGNLEPARYLLHGTPDEVTAKLAECHAIGGARFLVGAGCEVPQQTPHANLRAMVDYAASHGTA